MVDGLVNPSGAGEVTVDVVPYEAAEVSCADGVDNDVDGKLDCLDADCLAAPVCDPVCPELAVTTVPAVVTGVTSGLPDGHAASCDVSSSFPASDQSVAFAAPTDGDYVFALNAAATDFNTVLALSTSCVSAGDRCANGGDHGGEALRVSMLAGQEVVAFVDGFREASGSWQLEVREHVPAESDCFDGLDEDADGVRDCADPDCGLEPACTPTCPHDIVTTGSPAATDTTFGALDAHQPSCGTTGAGDLTFEFTAPTTSTYLFDTVGSAYDTVLAVFDGCGGGPSSPATTISSRPPR